jgi:NitT/TauT family transport system permease protein
MSNVPLRVISPANADGELPKAAAPETHLLAAAPPTPAPSLMSVASRARKPVQVVESKLRPLGLGLLSALRAQATALLLGMCSLGGLLLFWHLATTYRWDFYIRFTNLPTPMEVFTQLGLAMDNTKFITNVGMSLRRIAIGFAVATVLGVGLGLLIGRYKLMRQLMFPAIEAMRPIPAIAWVPISIMLWPDNEVSIVFITFIGAFFPILLNTVSGVQAVDSVLLRAGQCLGAREPQLMWQVVLPGAAPQVFTGLAVGMGVAWVSLIAAEMISGQFGVGYFTWEAYSLISYADIVLGMITIGVLGFGCSWLIRIAGRLCMPWLAYSKPGAQT